MAGSQGGQIQHAVGAVLKTGAQAGAGRGQSSLPLGHAWGCLASALWPHPLFMISHPYLSPVPETIRTARPHSHCIGKETRGSDGVCGLLQVTPPRMARLCKSLPKASSDPGGCRESSGQKARLGEASSASPLPFYTHQISFPLLFVFSG